MLPVDILVMNQIREGGREGALLKRGIFGGCSPSNSNGIPILIKEGRRTYQVHVFLLPSPIGHCPTAAVAPPTELEPSTAGSRHPFLKSPSFPSSSWLSLISLSLAALTSAAVGGGHHQDFPVAPQTLSSLPLPSPMSLSQVQSHRINGETSPELAISLGTGEERRRDELGIEAPPLDLLMRLVDRIHTVAGTGSGPCRASSTGFGRR